MADAGLDADVVLDIRNALAQVGRLEAALDRAANVVVTADARAVTAAIDAAVLNADSAVQIVGDAAEVTGSITAAVDAADTNVVVTGDATELTGEVTAAVDAGDSHVSITGDVDPSLAADVRGIGEATDNAADSAGKLKEVLGLLSVGAAVAGFRALADAASDLQESTSKATVVFGDNFAAIETFAAGAAESTGLASQEALEAAGTFGNLFQALGSTQEEAAALSPQVVQLAADLASFNNLGVDETLEKLRSGLVGEVEPLRSLGVSFLAADVAAKGLELGLAGANGEMTEGAKVQARLALIMEQTALAQGDFARTSDGLANQQRILSAELGNAAARAGTLLLPAFEALVAEGRNLIPGLETLAENLLPALGDALVNLAPLLGTGVDLLIALSPALELVAEVIAAIPSDVIALAGSFLLMNKAFGGLTSLLTGLGPALKTLPGIFAGTASAVPAATSGVGKLGAGLQSLAGTLGAVNPLMIGVGIAAVGAFREFQEGQAQARLFDERVDGLTDSLSRVGTEFKTAQQATTAFIEGLVKSGEESKVFADFGFTVADTLNALGLSAADASALIAGGEDALEGFAAGLGDVSDTQQLALIGLGQLAEQQQEATKATLAAKAATGDLTAVQKGQLERFNETGASAKQYADLLDQVNESQREAAAEAEATKEAYGPLADQYVATAESAERLGKSQPLLQAGLTALRTGAIEPTERTFFDLSVAIGNAALSEEEMADAAAQLGVDVETLKTISEAAAKALDDFVSTAVGQLPQVADAFKETGEDGILTVHEFIDNLNQSADDVAAFQFRLAALTAAGFAELAGEIAKQGPEIGGGLAERLTQALADGNVALIEEAESGVQRVNETNRTMETFLREELGPEMILTAGLLGGAITESFGSDLDFAERMRISGELAKTELTEEGKAIAAIAAVEGEDAARAYGEALGLDQETIDAAVEAGIAIGNKPPEPGYSRAGNRRGTEFRSGFEAALIQNLTAVEDKAAQIALAASRGVGRQQQSGSPSRVAMGLGRDFATGYAIGIEDEIGAAVAATQALVTDAAAAASAVPGVTVDLAAAGAAGDVSSTSVTFAAGSIVVRAAPGMSREEAEQVGEGIIDGAARALEQRQIAVLGRVQ